MKATKCDGSTKVWCFLWVENTSYTKVNHLNKELKKTHTKKNQTLPVLSPFFALAVCFYIYLSHVYIVPLSPTQAGKLPGVDKWKAIMLVICYSTQKVLKWPSSLAHLPYRYTLIRLMSDKGNDILLILWAVFLSASFYILSRLIHLSFPIWGTHSDCLFAMCNEIQYWEPGKWGNTMEICSFSSVAMPAPRRQ